MAMKAYFAFTKARALPKPHNQIVSYTGHPLGESYPSIEMQLVYSITPAEWTPRQRENARTYWDEKKKETQQLKQTIQLKEINQKVLAKKGRLKDIETG